MRFFIRLVLLGVVTTASASAQPELVNTNIDMTGFLAISREAANLRESRRVTETEFIRLSREAGTVILDARSRAMFDLLHVKGARNLSYPDISFTSLAQTFPDRSQCILIYCNNNFLNAPVAFATKMPSASLNLSTFISLYGYGYTNIYELGPLLDVKTTHIELVSSNSPKK